MYEILEFDIQNSHRGPVFIIVNKLYIYHLSVYSKL